MSLRPVVITDPMYVGRLKELQKEALQRTGGYIPSEDWQGILKMSHDNPNLSRIVGVFPDENTAPENMVAFSWSCNNGDNIEHYVAGSTRRNDARIPYGHLLVWKMIRWSKSTGAEWFDMGGVTLGGEEDEASLEGISKFKRLFSREVVEIGAEWVLEPAPVRARIANVVSNGASYGRELISNRG